MGLFSRTNDFRLDELERKIENLRLDHATLAKGLKTALEEIQDLTVKHDRLRGIVYNRKLHKTPIAPGEEPEQTPKEMSREELKRQLTLTGRFIPGKPVQHEG